MILYRNISITELNTLFDDGKIQPIFKKENVDSTYTKELGAVTCWFDLPFSIPYYDFFVTADIPDDLIVGEGWGEYHQQDIYDCSQFHTSRIKEFYTKGYSTTNVLSIYRKGSWRGIFLSIIEEIELWKNESCPPGQELKYLRENKYLLDNENFLSFSLANDNVINLLKKHLDKLVNINYYDDVLLNPAIWGDEK